METAKGLATVSLARGHEVTVFFNAESVKLLKAEIGALDVASLAYRGVRLLVCRTSAMECGITSLEELVGGAEMSSLGELVEMMESCDRALFIR